LRCDRYGCECLSPRLPLDEEEVVAS
jgi:hypothetical protein